MDTKNTEQKVHSKVGDANSLICVPEYATIDEMASAIVLSNILRSSGETSLVYFGDNNYPLAIQKLLPAGDTLFFQPQKKQEEFKVKIDLPNNTVKGLRWEQREDNLNIYIETSNEVSNIPNIDIDSPTVEFRKIYLLGTKNQKRIESYEELSKHTNIDTAEKIELLDNLEQPTVSEGILEFGIGRRHSFSEQELKLLLVGTKFGRFYTKEPYRKLHSIVRKIQKQEIQIPLNFTEINVLINFWEEKNDLQRIVESSEYDLGDVQALITLTPHLNPLIETFGIKTFSRPILRSVEIKNKVFYVTNDMYFKPKKTTVIPGSHTYRIYNNFVIGRYEISKETTEEEIHTPVRERPFILRDLDGDLTETTLKPSLPKNNVTGKTDTSEKTNSYPTKKKGFIDLKSTELKQKPPHLQMIDEKPVQKSENKFENRVIGDFEPLSGLSDSSPDNYEPLRPADDDELNTDF